MTTPIQYTLSNGKLNISLLTADLLAMHKAMMKTSKEFANGAALPDLVRQTYLESHGEAMRRAFLGS